MALDGLAKSVRALHEAVMSGRLENGDLDSFGFDTISADEIAGNLDPKEYKRRKIQLQNAMNLAVGGTNYRTYDDPRTETVVYYDIDKRREPSARRAVKSLPWASIVKRDSAGSTLELVIRVNPDNMSDIDEAVMTGGLGMMLGRKPTEDTKRPVEPAKPTEPIENDNGDDDDAPAGPQGAKPPFESMVTAAAQALLNGKDPHEAVEDLLGEGEPEDESEVIRAVEAGIATLNIEEKPPEELPPADTSAAPPEEV